MSITDSLPNIQYKWKRLLIPLGISIVTIGGLMFATRGEIDLSLFYKVNLFWILLAFLKMPVVLPVQALRWHIVLRARNVLVPFKQTFIGIMVRAFFNNITPGVGTGGEVAGAYYVSKKTGITFKTAMASSAAERIVQGLSVVAIAIATFALAIPFLPLESIFVKAVIVGLLWFVIFMGAMLYLSIFNAKWGKKLIEWVIRAITWFSASWRAKWNITRIRNEVDEFHGEYQASLKKKSVVCAVIGLTLVQAALEVLQPYFIFRALGVDVPMWIVLVSILIIRVIGVFAIMPGGSGLVEGANFGLYLVLTNVAHSIILTHTVLFRILDAWLLWLVSGIITAGAASAIFKSDNSGAEDILV